jgi:hypothetical protein
MKIIVAGQTKKGTDFFKFEMTQSEFSDNDNAGLCIFCGEQADGVEPDARKYTCESCEKRGVYGFEELLMMGFISFRC